MVANPFIIFVGNKAWRIGTADDQGAHLFDVEVPEDADLSHTAQQVAEAMTQQGYDGQAVALAIATGDCLCASIDTSALSRKNSRQEMIYRLEEQLPIAAEEFVAQFMQCDDSALSVCVQTAKTAPLVDALEQCLVRIELICPAALLALQGTPDNDACVNCDVLVWGATGHWELFVLDKGKPITWRQLPENEDDLAGELALHSLNRSKPLRVYTRNIDQSKLDSLASLPNVDLIGSDDESIENTATVTGCQILLGQQDARLNLRRGALAVADSLRQIRKPLNAAIAAVLLFLVFTSGAMLWRAGQYEGQTAQATTNQESIYRDLYPGKPVPISVKSRLASERRRLTGLHGDNQAPLTNTTPVLSLLHDVLNALPTKQRFRILELRIEGQELYLVGQAQRHSVADDIAASLTKHSPFAVEPPRTEQLQGKGISFTLRGFMPDDLPNAQLTSRQP